MSRRYYRHNSVLRFTKNEKMAFNALVDIVKMVVYVVTTIGKGIYEIIIYVGKMIDSHYALKKIGYDLNEVMNFVYNISPRQFEVFCAELFRQQGYDVKLTQPTADYGRDIILNGNIFVECKRYKKDNKIGREICQKLLGSMQMFNAKKGIIITTGTYHMNAYEVVRMVNNLELLDSTDIQKMILDLKPEQISKIMLRTKNVS